MKYLLQFVIELGPQNFAYVHRKNSYPKSGGFFGGVSNSGKQAYQKDLTLAYDIPVIQFLNSQYPNIYLLNNADNRKCSRHKEQEKLIELS